MVCVYVHFGFDFMTINNLPIGASIIYEKWKGMTSVEENPEHPSTEAWYDKSTLERVVLHAQHDRLDLEVAQTFCQVQPHQPQNEAGPRKIIFMPMTWHPSAGHLGNVCSWIYWLCWCQVTLWKSRPSAYVNLLSVLAFSLLFRLPLDKTSVEICSRGSIYFDVLSVIVKKV